MKKINKIECRHKLLLKDPPCHHSDGRADLVLELDSPIACYSSSFGKTIAAWALFLTLSIPFLQLDFCV